MTFSAFSSYQLTASKMAFFSGAESLRPSDVSSASTNCLNWLKSL
ncbi:Uncharacterised protein [Vibrio cholerae]|nr:Uncharacterised protein [Vibrio cholerae]